VIEGNAVAVSKDRETPIGPGSVVLVMPDEEHNFVNKGNTDFVFLCMIPLQK
jgi:mannose-6-phosphate isomerase-like protein (cupin superfamily)